MHAAESEKATGFSVAADKLVQTVNEWLGAIPNPMELTNEACARLNKISTETLENAERHGEHKPGKGNWQIAGFMARRELPDKIESYDCHIAIVNLGATNASNMLERTDVQMRKDLLLYVDRHCNRKGQSRETLATLYAMQDGASTVGNDGNGRDGGRTRPH